VSAPAIERPGVGHAAPTLPSERLLDACSGAAHLAPEGDEPGALVVYRRTGCAGAPVVVVLGGISAHRTAWDHDGRGRPAWWPEQVGRGRPIDADRFQVLTLDWVGGPDASAWIGVDPGVPDPPASPRVQVRALCAVLDTLGVARVHAIVGASFGGMVALAFAEACPARVERLVVLCAAHEADPATTALRSIQRRIVRLGAAAGRGDEALATARALAVIGYRSPEEFQVRFHGPAALEEYGVRHEVDGYLDHVGRKILGRFDTRSYLALSEGLDLHRVRPESIATPVFAWGARSDQVVPMRQMEALVSRLAGPVRLERAVSIYGHDAFLKEPRIVGRFLSVALAEHLPAWKEIRA
jgi:homoserine O-acetyltransferase/O-succinyltransferase